MDNNHNQLIEKYQHDIEQQMIHQVQPRKIVEHFGGNINEIKKWADLSSKDQLVISIKAFELEGLNDYVEVLKECLTKK